MASILLCIITKKKKGCEIRTTETAYQIIPIINYPFLPNVLVDDTT